MEFGEENVFSLVEILVLDDDDSSGGSGDNNFALSGDNTYLSTGLLGIGTSTPQEALDVTGKIHLATNTDPSGTDGTIRWSGTDLEVKNAGQWLSLTNSGSSSSSSISSYLADADGDTSVETEDTTNSTNRMIVTSLGNVGIGTTSPSATLDVVGNGQFSSGLNVGFSGTPLQGRIGFGDINSFIQSDATSTTIQMDTSDYISYDKSTNVMKFSNGGTESLLLKTSNHVVVAGSSNMIFDVNAGTTDYSSINFNHSNNTTPVNKWSLSSRGTASSPTYRLGIWNANVATEVMTILQSGNVGIGQNNPSTKLEVNGDIKTSGSLILPTGTQTQPYITTSAFHVEKTTNQTLTSGVVTLVDWDVEAFDEGNDFDLATDEFKAPIDGIYQFSAVFTYYTGVSNSYVAITLAKNGTSYKNVDCATNSSVQVSCTLSLTLKLGANDSISVNAWHNMGADKDLFGEAFRTYFSGHLVTPAN